LLRASGHPLKTFTQSEPLTDTELDRLAAFLKSCKDGRAMNIEQLEGFFPGLIAGPETVMPSEYNREVFGGGEMAILRQLAGQSLEAGDSVTILTSFLERPPRHPPRR
jgi:hypothetical protein